MDPDQLKILQWNCRSIRNKIDDHKNIIEITLFFYQKHG